MSSICRRLIAICPTKRLVVSYSYSSTMAKPKTKPKPKPTGTNSSSSSATNTVGGDTTSQTSPHSPSWNILLPAGEPEPAKSSGPAPARPGEIPFQAKVSNSVHLIGYVHAAVQFETSANGSSWAATVITQQNPSSSDDSSDDALPLWVPTVFEGDLAHIAASHLKVNDRVYVAGKLSASLPHLSYNQFQASVQVMVHDLNFVEESVQNKKIPTFSELEKETPFIKEIEKGVLKHSDRVKKDGDAFLSSWMDLLDNPKEWLDFRDKKLNGSVKLKYPDFKRKDGSCALWLNSAPEEVLNKLAGPENDVQIKKSNEVNQFKEGDSALNSWNDLIDHPKKWWDYRNGKLNGVVNPKHPDFKYKDGSHALWLSSAPQWVSSKLEGLDFDVPIPKSKDVNGSKGDELWNDLLKNPNKWWDNRVDKRNERAPDFKHKETNEVLWLSNSPTWVLSKLPPPRSKPDVAKRTWYTQQS
ncbi:Single-stranded DNA-binding protein [Parasponia andersonii]|uniref:Single-stranded DNA-binding protein n=1 Tax=Parasponia andersonii TaxID=3476 RepID=A0A2P5D5P3_PARAD|nr:Single-stranded DNA-binding protein [Parasponia andersonii]